MSREDKVRNLQRFVTLVVWLIVTIVLATGCKPANGSGGLSASSPQATPLTSSAFISPPQTPRPTPRLSSAIQVGDFTELTPSDTRLKDWQLNKAHIDGDVLFATTGIDDHPQAVAINLRNGNIARLENSFGLDSQWPTTQRYFAWTETSNGGMTKKLYAYELATGKKIAIKGESDVQSFPDISGDTVVWSELHGDHSWDIYAYRIASGQLIAAVTRTGSQNVPKIEGDWVVYLEGKSADPRDMTGDVYLHNLTTGEDFLLGTSPYAFGGGTYGIAHGRVVWVGWTPAEFKQPLGLTPPFHVYDLQTRTDRVLDNWSTCAPTGFQLAGDLIQFHCQDGFYGYDLAKDDLFSISLPRGVGQIYFSETRVVYQMEVEQPRIYLTPGAPTPTPGPYVAEPMKYRLFVEPINRR